MENTVTYSPDDDKLRIYPACRLPADEYQTLKSAGYGWAPKQECFYAVWSPSRERVALQFADEIEDEDKSLVERAEERADRFENYSEKRMSEYEQAHGRVKQLADAIPFGQPILVGHHSEKHARKHAQQIEDGMRRAVRAFETSEYWEQRAAGALAHAKYKERPDVRARRIKGLESDLRKNTKTRAEAVEFMGKWQAITSQAEAMQVANYDHLSCCFTLEKYPRTENTYEGMQSLYSAMSRGIIDHQQAAAIAIPSKKRVIAWCDQWIEHINNRLLYERAMLAESGGLVADKFDLQVGGQVRHRFGWSIIKRINKKAGAVLSVSLIATSYPTVVNIEEIMEYKAPAEGDTEKVKTATKAPPLCNYRTEGCAVMTQAQYTAQYKDHKGSDLIPATDTHAAHRLRCVDNFVARKFGAVAASQWGRTSVFLSDAKITAAPALQESPQPVDLPPVERAQRTAYTPQPDQPNEVQAMKQAIKTGVQVVTAPQLFPTPPEIAAQMVALAEIGPGMTVLEPSAGTGNIMQAITNDDQAQSIVAVEINSDLASRLQFEYPLSFVHCMDFLEYGRGYSVDRIIMNPPFTNGSDIKHINHAFTMLRPGGRLVALCANGPRQQAAFRGLADHWEDLPAGSFASRGTGVNVALLVMDKR